MEAHQGSNSSSTGESSSPVIIKRKRTNRRRALLPPPPATAASSATSGTTTEEDEDMANCLILLARGHTFPANGTVTAAVITAGQAGSYLYECKTCNKGFPSFQALGGHRASHKKPKTAAKEEGELMSSTSKPPTAASTAGKPRIHECSVCAAEFASGQALGGHMRRHRPAVFPEIVGRQLTREKRGFSLDLNLPAPADDEPFGRTGAGNHLVFSPPSAAAALVDCYY